MCGQLFTMLVGYVCVCMELRLESHKFDYIIIIARQFCVKIIKVVDQRIDEIISEWIFG